MFTFAVHDSAARDVIQICPSFLKKWEERRQAATIDGFEEALKKLPDFEKNIVDFGLMDHIFLHEVCPIFVIVGLEP